MNNGEIIVINGPNLGKLGTRQADIYGSTTLQDIIDGMEKPCQSAGYSLSHFQSNHEGKIIDYIEGLDPKIVKGGIINPGALMMNGYALLDCLYAASMPFVEVHISNLYRREEFRHKSIISPACEGHVFSFGPYSYEVGLFGLLSILGTSGAATS